MYSKLLILASAVLTAFANDETEKEYFFVEVGQNIDWAQALSACMEEGGELVKINNDATNTKIHNNMVANGISHAWLGGYVMGQTSEGDDFWVWLDKTAFSYSNWASNKPTGGQSQCLTMQSDGKWVDHECTTTSVTIAAACQRQRFGSYICGRTDTEYFIAPSMQGVSWYQAKKVCEGWGAKFAIIYASYINTNIYALLSQNGETTGWFGLTDANTEGVWKWEDGVFLGDDYENFANGEPNNAGDEDCAHIWSPGTWNDLRCSRTDWTKNAICQTGEYWRGRLGMEVLFKDSFVAVKFPIPYTYHRAELWCRWQLGMGVLSSVHDSETNVEIQKALDFLEVDEAWIGVYSDGSEWKFSDRSAFNFERWDATSSTSGAAATQRAVFDTETGLWSEVNRRSTYYGAVCEGRSFSYHIDPLGFDDANDRCHDIYNGMELSTVHANFRDIEMELATSTYGHTFSFFGYKDDLDESTWYWIDGTPTVYTRWNSDSSRTASGSNDCSGVLADGTWHHSDCETSSPYFCGTRAGQANSVVSEIGNYRVSKFYGDYESAHAYCQGVYGASIGSIDGIEKNDAVQLAAQALGLTRIWIGYESNNDQVWEWRDGSDSAWTNWMPNKPQAHGHTQMIVDTGLWENVDGSNQFAGVLCNVRDPELPHWPIEWNFDEDDVYPVYHATTTTRVTEGIIYPSGAVKWYQTTNIFWPEDQEELSARSFWARIQLDNVERGHAILNLDSQYLQPTYIHTKFDGIHYNELLNNFHFELGTEYHYGESYSGYVGGAATVGQWYDVVLTEDPVTQQVCIYVDGEIYQNCYTSDRFSSAYPTGLARMLFGKRHQGCTYTTCFMDGAMSYAALYNTALTATEVAAIYAERSANYPKLAVKSDRHNVDEVREDEVVAGVVGSESSVLSTQVIDYSKLYLQLASITLIVGFVFYIKYYAKPRSLKLKNRQAEYGTTTSAYGSV